MRFGTASADLRRTALTAVLGAWALAVTTAFAQAPALEEELDGPELDANRWVIVRDGDFQESAVDLAPEPEGDGKRLRLMAATIGCTDPMKYLGLRTKEALSLSPPLSVEWELDWNNQANGCYLSAALYLCPTAAENPMEEPDWFKVEYVGVPPGKNVRLNVWHQEHGALRELLTDWGPRDQQGRPQGKPFGNAPKHLRLDLTEKAVSLSADGEELWQGETRLPFDSAYLYLLMSTGTNYPRRELFFDNVRVTALEATGN